MIKKLLLATTLSLALFAADSIPKDVIQTGNEASKLLLQTLGKNLKMHIKKDGLVEGAKYCTLNAYALTQKVNKELGKNVTIKRVSKRYRNPDNAPNEEDIDALNEFESYINANEKLPPYLVRQDAKNVYTYYKPLLIKKEVCLKCHGMLDRGAKITQYLVKTYPTDMAKDYHMNDLRGAIVVTIKR